MPSMAYVAEGNVRVCSCSHAAATPVYGRPESGSFAGTSARPCCLRENRACVKYTPQTSTWEGRTASAIGVSGSDRLGKTHSDGLWPDFRAFDGPACLRGSKVHIQSTRCFQEAPTAARGEERAAIARNSSGRSQTATAEQPFAGLPVLEREKLAEEDGRLYHDRRRPLKTEQDLLLSQYIPIYVMLPLDTVTPENTLSHPERLLNSLRALKAAGVDGCMADVWWGVVEKSGPKQYDWSAYRVLFKHVQSVGLKMQVVMSFHQCGGNTGDSCYIPLPPWVLEIGEMNPDIFFTNRDRMRNREYLSFSIDERPELNGRSAIQVYKDFMVSFRTEMSEFFEAGLFHEIEVGVGPAGELRFPSYPETHGWRFPGIGEFQCYDRYMLEQLGKAAEAVDRYEWGYSGPHDSGRYNDWPHATGFFGSYESFNSEYGRFFLEWYSSMLLKHGDKVLEAASQAFEGCTTRLAAKVAGVHWWYNSRNHAAELAAGYYNTRERDGYLPIAAMLKRHNATLNFTCIEMRNSEQWFEAKCSPEGLVQQVLNAAWSQGVEVSCENALPRYDTAAFDQILRNARPDGVRTDGMPVRRISSFTFLRLGPDLMIEHNWNEFVRFVRQLHAGLDYHPTPELYFNPLRPIQATFAETTVVPPPVAVPKVEDLPAAAPVHTTQEGQDQSGSFFSNVFGWSSKKGPDGPVSVEPPPPTPKQPTSLILKEDPPTWFSFLSPPPQQPEIEPLPETESAETLESSPEPSLSSAAAPSQSVETSEPPSLEKLEARSAPSPIPEPKSLPTSDPEPSITPETDIRDTATSASALGSPRGPPLDGPMLEPLVIEEGGELWKGNLEVGKNRLLPIEEPAPLVAPRRSVESGAIETMGGATGGEGEDSLSAYYGRLARNALEKKRALERGAHEEAPAVSEELNSADMADASRSTQVLSPEGGRVDGSGEGAAGVFRFLATTFFGLAIGLALWLCSPSASASRFRIAAELDHQVSIATQTVLTASKEVDSARRRAEYLFLQEPGSYVQAIKASVERGLEQTAEWSGQESRVVEKEFEQGKRSLMRVADLIGAQALHAREEAGKLGLAAKVRVESWIDEFKALPTKDDIQQ